MKKYMARAIRIKHDAEETPEGLMIPKTVIEVKQPYFAVEISSNAWKVVSEAGVTERVYEGLDAKKNAESYAGKLSLQFRPQS